MDRQIPTSSLGMVKQVPDSLSGTEKHLLIGSRALNYWFPQHKVTTETDWDVITYSDLHGVERHDPDFLNNKDFEQFTCNTHRVMYKILDS